MTTFDDIHREELRKKEARKGGSAFPHDAGMRHPGIDVRDYFAAEALKPIMESFYSEGLMVGDKPNADSVAHIAYTVADAMIKARAL